MYATKRAGSASLLLAAIAIVTIALAAGGAVADGGPGYGTLGDSDSSDGGEWGDNAVSAVDVAFGEDVSIAADGETVETADVSNADEDGHLHVVYVTDDAEIRYVRVTSDGEVIDRTPVATVEDRLQRLDIVADADGTAHVVWNERDTNPNFETIARATVRDGTVIDTYEPLSKEVNLTESYRIEAVESDPRGGALVIRVHEECPHPDYEYTISVLAIDADSPSHEKQRLHGFETGSGYGFRADVAVRDETVVLGFTEGAFDNRTLRAHEYRLTDEGIEEVSVWIGDTESSGTVRDVSVHPNGTGVISHSVGDGDVVFTNGHGFVDSWYQSGIWTEEDRLYGIRSDTYSVYDADGTVLQSGESLSGFEAWGVHAGSGPGVLLIDDGELLYRALPADPPVEESGAVTDDDAAQNGSDDDSDGSESGSDDEGSNADDAGATASGDDVDSRNGGAGSDDDPSGGTVLGAPGFGIVVASIAVLVGGILAYRRRS